MIHVLAEVERNINIAVEDKEEYSYSSMYMALFLIFLGLFCIGYYIAGVTYAGFGVSMIPTLACGRYYTDSSWRLDDLL